MRWRSVEGSQYLGREAGLNVSAKGQKPNYLRDVSEPACADKAGLLKDYQEKTAAFSESVDRLQELRGTSPLSEYQRMQRRTEEARIKSEQARHALEEHIAQHRC